MNWHIFFAILANGFFLVILLQRKRINDLLAQQEETRKEKAWYTTWVESLWQKKLLKAKDQIQQAQGANGKLRRLLREARKNVRTLEKELNVVDLVSPPGDTIMETLAHNEMSVEEFAEEIKESVDFTLRLIEGREPITKDLAIRLQVVLNIDAEFWLNRDRLFRENIVAYVKHRKSGQTVS